MTDFIFTLEREPDLFEMIPIGVSFSVGGALHAWDVARLWSDAELAAIGCYRVPRAELPIGHTLVGERIERVDGVLTHVIETQPPPEQPAPVPSCTRRQMLLGLKNAGYITAAEAKAAAATGAVPTEIQVVIDNLPTQQERDDAEITWASLSQCERNHPLVLMLQAHRSLTDAQVDALLRNWATL